MTIVNPSILGLLFCFGLDFGFSRQGVCIALGVLELTL